MSEDEAMEAFDDLPRSPHYKPPKQNKQTNKQRAQVDKRLEKAARPSRELRNLERRAEIIRRGQHG